MIRQSLGGSRAGLSRGLELMDLCLMVVAAAAIGAIMIIVTLDATLRYTMNAPLSWSYDLIGLYLMVAVFFLTLPDTLNHHAHIAVDLFQRLIPFRWCHLFLGIGYAMSTWVMVLITWGGFRRLDTAIARGEHIAALIPWPTWVAYLLVVVGSAALVIRCVYRVYGHLASAITGRLLVDMPPVADESGGGGGDI